MASSEDYARWIVDNSSKKGTPEFDTVAQAYQASKQSQSTAPAEEPKQRTLPEELLRQGGLTMRAGVEGISSLTNPINRFLGIQTPGDVLTKRGVPTPETGAEKIAQAGMQGALGGMATGGMAGAAKPLSQAGQGIAEAMAARPGAQALGGALGSSAGEAAGQIGAPPAVQTGVSIGASMLPFGLRGRSGPSPPGDAVLDQTRAQAQKAGYITPPEGGVKAALSGLAGKAKTEKTLSHLNEENATNQFAKELTGGEPLSKESLKSAKEQGYAAYQGMKNAVGPYLKPTAQFRDAMGGTLADVEAKLKFDPETYKGLKGTQSLLRSWLKKTEPREVTAAPGKEVPRIYQTLDKAIAENPQSPLGRTLETTAAESPHGYGGLVPPPSSPIASLPSTTAFPTKLTLEAIKNLRSSAKDHYIAGDRELGLAKYGIANQLENMFEANLAQTGQQSLVNEFREARTKLAQINFAEQVVNDATGKVDLGKVRSLSDTKQYRGVLTGALKDAADFAKAFPKAAQKVTGEPSPSLSVFDGMFAVSSLAAGHPWAAATELGGRMLIPEMAKRGLLQQQGSAGSMQGQSGIPPALLNMLMQRGGALGPPIGIGAAGQAQIQDRPQ